MGKISKRQRQKNLEPHFCMEDADSTNDKNNNIPSPPESNPSPTSPACSSTPNNSSPMTLSPELSLSVYHPYAHHHHHSSVSQRFPDPALINQVISELDPETRNKIDKQITLPLEELIRPTLKSRKGNIPRPQNLFVIYRKDLQAKLVLKHGPDVGSNLALVSKRASKSWERESQSIREIFEVIAELAKKVHERIYPVSQRFPDPALINQVISELDPETRNKIDKQITLPLEELIRPTLKSRKGNIPRPQNLFVIYRKDLQAKLVLKHGPDVGSNLALVSKRASKSWERESQSIREIFEVIAELAKKVHERIYPGYVYKPKKRLLKSAMKNLDEFILQDDKFYESNGDGDDVIGDKIGIRNK
ncbi:1453_t:CDS:2 [Entrophospora sp. SA101]|nr:1453_t:CDS:2 [Entrophospora sp. SA101]